MSIDTVDIVGGAADSGGVDPLIGSLEEAPHPFVATKGRAHEVVYVNPSFRRLMGTPQDLAGRPIHEILHPEATTRLESALDRVLERGLPVQDHFLGRLTGRPGSWSCSIWPRLRKGTGFNGLAIELRVLSHSERSIVLQREVTERLLLSALREAELADIAAASRDRTTHLLEAGRLLGRSLDEGATRDTVAGIALPALGSWCIVDVLEAKGDITRLAMIHPDARKQEILTRLARDWPPRVGDLFGAPVILRDTQPVVTKVDASDVAGALSAVAHDSENLRLVAELGVGPLLTVPLVSYGKILGAVTFVSGDPGRAYSREDVELAEGLAALSAEALNSARLYGEAVSLREQAEASSRYRMRFLGNISHELRTPLNVIMGYTQLMQEEIHGPVTSAQRHDLERIRVSQEHLGVLVSDILGFVGAGLVPVTEFVGVPLDAAVAQAVEMVETQAAEKKVALINEAANTELVVDSDADRLRQILINLLSNGIKFTPAGGSVVVRCLAGVRTVEICVSDNGVGIPAEKLDAIFEPFVQVKKTGGAGGGVGLGLAISRDLARTLRGDLAVESTLGVGSCFTLTLPRPIPTLDLGLGETRQ